MGQFDFGNRSDHLDFLEHIKNIYTLTSPPIPNSIDKDSEDGKENIEGEDMTLIVGIKASGAIIMAADKRGTIPTGQYIDDKEKLHIFTNIALGISGKGDMGPTIFQACKETLEKEHGSIHQLASAVSSDLRGAYNQWFPYTLVRDRPNVHLMLCGFTNNDAAIYELDSGSEFFPEMSGGEIAFLSIIRKCPKKQLLC